MAPKGQFWSVICVFLLSVIVSGCVSSSAEKAIVGTEPSLTDRFETWQETRDVYRLQNGDLLEIVHPYARDLDRTVRVLPDGRIFLPLVGPVVATDVVPEKLAQEIETIYRSQQMKKPAVTVIPKETNPQKFFIGGEVNKPGMYEFQDRIGVAEAVFMAGGMRNSAADDQVVLLRRTPNDRAMMRTIDVAGVLSGRAGTGDVPLRQYDIVYVPRTAAAEVAKFVEQYITNILPFSRSFSYSLSRDVN